MLNKSDLHNLTYSFFLLPALLDASLIWCKYQFPLQCDCLDYYEEEDVKAREFVDMLLSLPSSGRAEEEKSSLSRP